jgi:hypothetical protein
MALSLALGLGLQGAPKDYVDVYMARQKGKAAAEQKAAEAKAKELDPIKKQLLDFSKDDYLTKGRSRVFDAAASTIDFAVKDPNNLGEITKMFMQVGMLAQKEKNEREMVKKIETDRNYGWVPDNVLNLVRNESDPKKLAELNNNLVSPFKYDETTNSFTFNPHVQINITDDVTKTLNNPNYYDFTTKSQTPIRIGQRDMVMVGLKPEAAQLFTQKLSDPNYRQSLRVEYYENLKNLNTLPDFSTPQGRADFDKGAENFLADKVQGQINNFTKVLSGYRGQGNTFNLYTGDQNKPTPFDIGKTSTKMGIANPITGQTEIMNVTDYFGFSGGNFKFVGAPSGNAYYNNTGKPVNRADIRNGDFSTFKGRLILTRDIKDKSGEVLYPKGMSVPEEYEKFAINNGIVKAGIIVEGEVNNESVIADATGLYPNAFSAVSKDEKPQLEASYKQAREKQDELQGWLDKNSGKNKDSWFWNVGKKPAAAAPKTAAPTGTKPAFDVWVKMKGNQGKTLSDWLKAK